MTDERKKRTEWFRKAKWGVICHYLAAPVTSGLKGSDKSVDEWNARVDAFDVKKLADQLERAGAGYFYMTLGQNSGYYCSPNATYDSIVGIKPSKLSKRDLVSDIADALKPKGIKVCVYLPSGAPAADTVAMEKLEWEWGFVGGWPKGWMVERTGKRLVNFQRKWEAVIREWSMRWGDKVNGWFIDGCYFPEMYNHPDEPNYKSFAAAMRSGNPNSIVAFSPGLMMPIISVSPEEDYTAGEVDGSLYVAHRTKKDEFLVYDGDVDGAQLHSITFLGEYWGQGKPRFNDAMAAGYTEFFNSHNGVITWDVPITDDGKIPEEFITQMAKFKR